MQLWRPVTIRGYTFNIADNLALDQTKIQKSPGSGGDFAWLYAAYQAHGMTEAEFLGPRYYRLKVIRGRIERGELDKNLRWIE